MWFCLASKFLELSRSFEYQGTFVRLYCTEEQQEYIYNCCYLLELCPYTMPFGSYTVKLTLIESILFTEHLRQKISLLDYPKKWYIISHLILPLWLLSYSLAPCQYLVTSSDNRRSYACQHTTIVVVITMLSIKHPQIITSV